MNFVSPSGHTAVAFRFDTVTGRPLAAGYQLSFVVRCDIHPRTTAGPTTFRVERALLELQPSGLRFGFGVPEQPVILVQETYVHDTLVPLLFDVTVSTIEAIERLRSGGDLEFRLVIYGERIVSHSEHIAGPPLVTSFAELRLRINQKTWTDALSAMGYGTFLLCEIPVPVRGAAQDIKELCELMERARRLLYSGDYDEVVVNCRRAMERLGPAAIERLGISAAQLGRRDERDKMAKKDRIMAVFAAARHCSHLGAHASSDGPYASFNRSEALLVFANTAAAISVLAADPELGGSPGRD